MALGALPLAAEGSPPMMELFKGELGLQKDGRIFEIPAPGGNVQEGAFDFCFRLQRRLEIPKGCKAQKVTQIKIPGFGSARLELTGDPGKSRRELRFLWEAESGKGAMERYLVYFLFLEADKDYHLTLSWNAARGLFQGYVNGFAEEPEPGSDGPWKSDSGFSKVEIAAGDFVLRGLHFSRKWHGIEEVAHFLGQPVVEVAPPELGQSFKDVAFDLPPVKTVLYENTLAAAANIEGWQLEGPGRITFKDGWMEMASPDEGPHSKGHHTFWCPFTAPANYLLEWEFKKLNTEGLHILFIDAMGLDGKDIFDPALKPRDGDFKQYWNGDIRNYHFSYSDEGHIVRVNKNPAKTLFSMGRRPNYEPGKAYRLAILKQGSRIAFTIDGKTCFDTEDNEAQYGAVWKGGKIGFRQMSPGRSAYRNLRVRGLE